MEEGIEILELHGSLESVHQKLVDAALLNKLHHCLPSFLQVFRSQPSGGRDVDDIASNLDRLWHGNSSPAVTPSDISCALGACSHHPIEAPVHPSPLKGENMRPSELVTAWV
jgi:hypothetical protein